MEISHGDLIRSRQSFNINQSQNHCSAEIINILIPITDGNQKAAWSLIV